MADEMGILRVDVEIENHVRPGQTVRLGGDVRVGSWEMGAAEKQQGTTTR